MVSITCHAGNGPDDLWAYCPSFGAALAFCILFGITSCAHIVQAFIYRKPFAAVLIMGGLWEFGGYVARMYSIEKQRDSGIFTAQLLLILLAPLWINAYIYMLLGRMIHFFLDRDRVFGVRSRLITRMFVIFDIVAFLIQATGGTMTGPGASPQTQKIGLNVYTGGVGAQLFFLAIFVLLAIGFQRNLKLQRSGELYHSADVADPESQRLHGHPEFPQPSSSFRIESPSPLPTPDARLATPLLRLLYAVMTLVIIRNIYRLVEFATGSNSPTIKHEWYAYVFDAVPMLIALVLLNIFNPGKTLQGPRSDFSEQDKERKAAKKEAKALKRAEKRAHKEMKKVKNGKAFGTDAVGYESLK